MNQTIKRPQQYRRISGLLVLAVALLFCSPALAKKHKKTHKKAHQTKSKSDSKQSGNAQDDSAQPNAAQSDGEQTDAEQADGEQASAEAKDGEEPAGPSLRRGNRMEFDARLIRGEAAGSGAVFLFQRAQRPLPSLIKKRTTFLRDTVDSLLGEQWAEKFDQARTQNDPTD